MILMTTNEILLVEKQIIKSSHPYFKQLDELCFLSKNLYNVTLYEIRKHYFETKKYKTAFTIIKEFTAKNQIDFRALPAKVSRYTIQLVDQNMRSFFALLKKKQKNQYTKPVRLPNYLDKFDGRQTVHYHKRALSLINEGFIKLSKTNIVFKTKVPNHKIQYLRLVHCGNHIKVLIGYYKTKKSLSEKRERFASIDIGQNNLMTVTSNVFHPVIYNGKPIKSINQFYNKIKAKEQSDLKKINNLNWSKRLGQLTLWRENQINNQFHKVTSHFVKYCIVNKIDTVIIGRNKGWKDGINLSKRINQNFVTIPLGQLYDLLSYKLEMNGIRYIEVEESHTSKCSFIDKEEIRHHEEYVGRRIKRGMFRSENGKKYNADINGSLNVMRKHLTNTSEYNNSLHGQMIGFMTEPKKVRIEN